MTALTGGCLCGAVRWELSQPPRYASYCHCTRCQKRTGNAYSANARSVPGSFRIVAGEERVRRWRHPDGGWLKAFCGECGSPLFSQDPDDPDRVGVRMGSFDADPGVELTHHQYVAYAASWEPLADDGLPRHPEARPAGA